MIKRTKNKKTRVGNEFIYMKLDKNLKMILFPITHTRKFPFRTQKDHAKTKKFKILWFLCAQLKSVILKLAYYINLL